VKRAYFLVATSLPLVLAVSAWSADFKPYPDAKLDPKATQDAQEGAAMVHAKASVYTTTDAFEKVYDFYKGVAKETTLGHFSPKGTTSALTGQTMKAAFFIFDDAPTLASSKLWIKVQRPAIGLYKEDLKGVNDVTAIVVSETK